MIWRIFLDCDLGFFFFFFTRLVKLCFGGNVCWIVLFVFYVWV